MSSKKSYTKEEVIDLIQKNNEDGLIRVNGTLDQILTNKRKVEPLETTKFDYKIHHSSFRKLLIKRIDFTFLFDCVDVKGLTKNIIKLSKNYIDYGYSHVQGENKMKGDLFEIFAEIFFKLTSSDNRVGITNYKPVKDIDDYGVDGTGVAINGEPATVQVKFRSNPTDLMTIKDLKNLHGISYKQYSVPVNSNKNIIIFTNCSGIHWNTQVNVLRNSTLTYGYYKQEKEYNLKYLIDNNNSFWSNVNKMIKFNIDELLK